MSSLKILPTENSIPSEIFFKNESKIDIPDQQNLRGFITSKLILKAKGNIIPERRTEVQEGIKSNRIKTWVNLNEH